jgi:hypothetical protein
MTNSYDPMMADPQDMTQNVRNITDQVDTSNIQTTPPLPPPSRQPPFKKKKKA